MSSPLYADESFQNLGGINIKASPYLTGPQQFLDIVNYDFQTPGSLSQRWGSTQYFTQSYTGAIQSLFEYSKLDGSSYLVFSVSGGLWYGGTQGQFQGVSIAALGFGASYRVEFKVFLRYVGVAFDSVYTQYADGNYVTSSTTHSIPPDEETDLFLTGSSVYSNRFDFAVLNNNLYASDGYHFLKSTGTQWTNYQIPPVFNNDFSSQGLDTGGSYVLPMTHSYIAYAAYEMNDGTYGPMWPVSVYNVGPTYITGVSSFGVVAAVATIPSLPARNIVTAIGITSNYPTGSTPPPYTITSDIWNQNVRILQKFPFAGSTFQNVYWGMSGGNPISQIETDLQSLPTTLSSEFQQALGVTTSIGTGSTFYPGLLIDTSQFAPKYLEIYNNQLFMANFIGMPSTVYFSNIADPDIVDVENFIEVRTNDGDQISGMANYNSNLYIFKEFSFHELSGTDPDNFTLRQVTDQYGCLNNRAIAAYDNVLLFLDRKGVMKFNGAGWSAISGPVQNYFDRLNVNQARISACMVHDKQRNEVLIAIPIDGSTTNNITIVYDYLVDAWTTYRGYVPSLFQLVRGTLNNKTVFYGGISGNIFNFGASFSGDNGAGMTLYFKSRWYHELGDSIQKQFRRLYLNVDPVVSSTQIFNLNFYQDYGITLAFSTTMFSDPFQSRVDFGIDARSMSFEMYNFNSTEHIRVHGYVITYRVQRTK